jgi:hypothetical protein
VRLGCGSEGAGPDAEAQPAGRNRGGGDRSLGGRSRGRRRQAGPSWQREREGKNAWVAGLRRNGLGLGKEKREEREPKGEKRVGRRGPCGKREGKTGRAEGELGRGRESP